mmetsp:Transcript_7718/g.9108  ORF Transcript_7718/g.9108 Transcript_7718/m.9108 type:complete len:205 (-) Transcript_7718:19-633(-)
MLINRSGRTFLERTNGEPRRHAPMNSNASCAWKRRRCAWRNSRPWASGPATHNGEPQVFQRRRCAGGHVAPVSFVTVLTKDLSGQILYFSFLYRATRYLLLPLSSTDVTSGSASISSSSSSSPTSTSTTSSSASARRGARLLRAGENGRRPDTAEVKALRPDAPPSTTAASAANTQQRELRPRRTSGLCDAAIAGEISLSLISS